MTSTPEPPDSAGIRVGGRRLRDVIRVDASVERAAVEVPEVYPPADSRKGLVHVTSVDDGWSTIVHELLASRPRTTEDPVYELVVMAQQVPERDPFYDAAPHTWREALRWIAACASYAWRRETGQLRSSATSWRFEGVKLWSIKFGFVPEASQSSAHHLDAEETDELPNFRFRRRRR